MPAKFEITVPLPLERVIKRIEAARKQMAPAIGPCISTKDLSSFTCRLDYFSTYALLKATAMPDNDETKVLVEIDDRRVGNMPIGIVTAIACLLFQLPLCAMVYMSPHRNWLFIVALIIIPAGLLLLFMPFSKHVLSRFVHDILLNDTQS
jgi:hypothetical protein